MSFESILNLLSACCGERRVTIGLESPEALRELSDQRELTCPGCGQPVVLKAGTVRAHHFAHLPGAECRFGATEPETEEHRNGKLLLAEWLRTCFPDDCVIVEAPLQETGQRADLLIISKDGSRRIAIEYQCANLPGQEWLRRHRLYREHGIYDLWLLGGSRLQLRSAEHAAAGSDQSRAKKGTRTGLKATELERTLIWIGAPLLFIDSTGESMQAGEVARFRPDNSADLIKPMGWLSKGRITGLAFPEHLLDWKELPPPDAPLPGNREAASARKMPIDSGSILNGNVWEWLKSRHHLTPDTLSPMFGIELPGSKAFRCGEREWQAAIYYRFVHQQIGCDWNQAMVENWVRVNLPLVQPIVLTTLRRALSEYQTFLSAAGMLSLPTGMGRRHSRVRADLLTLPEPPDRDKIQKLARWRSALKRD